MVLMPMPVPVVDPRQAAATDMFERLVLLLAKKLGIATQEPLSDRVREWLAKGREEMAVIEYRKETGAELEPAFHAVRNGGKLDLPAIFDRVLAELDRRFPDASLSQVFAEAGGGKNPSSAS